MHLHGEIEGTNEPRVVARQFSRIHREQVLSSDTCGCFYCLKTFRPAEIEEWVDEAQGTGVGQTALCPRCGIDSVLGSASGFPLTNDFLQRMNSYWF